MILLNKSLLMEKKWKENHAPIIELGTFSNITSIVKIKIRLYQWIFGVHAFFLLKYLIIK